MGRCSLSGYQHKGLTEALTPGPGSQGLLQRVCMTHSSLHLDVCASPHQKRGIQSGKNVAINNLIKKLFRNMAEGEHAWITEVRASVSLGAFVHAENVILEWVSLEVQTKQRFYREGDTLLLTTCSPFAHFLAEHSRALSLDGVCPLLVCFCV